MRLAVFLATSCVVLALAGCSPPAEQSGLANQKPAADIAWFEGSVEDAFALAKTESRPLFLYWGAEWCPPCHYLKNKIFKQPEFVARMASFIPVYLDGDTERAQILGEKLDVQGYPTVIVFTPDGEEVMRMASSIPIAQYADVLDAAVQVMRPVEAVLTSVVESGPANAPRTDLNLLAFYSWGQDSKSGLEDEAKLETFGKLYRETPEDLRLQRSRFLSLYLQELLDAEPEEDLLAATERAALAKEMAGILTDPDLRNANLFPVLYMSRGIVELLHPEPSAEREALAATWLAAAREAEEDSSLSLDDRLSALVPQISLAKLEQEEDGEGGEEETPLPDPLLDHIRERVSWATENVADEGELQAVMNTMVYLLRSSGLEDEAETLLTEKMGETTAPYYFMSYLASVKKDAGETEEALVWYRKAYDASRGRYSRFRWGSTYLRRLLEISPDNEEMIESASLEVLDELLSHDDAFALGNHSRLESLANAYVSWNEGGAHDALIGRLRDRVRDECGRYPDEVEDSQRARCEAFLAG